MLYKKLLDFVMYQFARYSKVPVWKTSENKFIV